VGGISIASSAMKAWAMLVADFVVMAMTSRMD
jgi:hypothetical protein